MGGQGPGPLASGTAVVSRRKGFDHCLLLVTCLGELSEGSDPRGILVMGLKGRAV